MGLVGVRVVAFELGGGAHLFGARRVIAELFVVEAEIDDVEAEGIDTAFQPEADDVEGFLLDSRVVVVQVGLFTQEIVEVILFVFFAPFPCGATKDGDPIIGRQWSLSFSF